MSLSDEDEEYDPEIVDNSNIEAKFYHFAQEWFDSLNRDDIMSIYTFLHPCLSDRLHYSKGDFVKMISELLGYSLGSRELALLRMIFVFLILLRAATKDQL